MMAMRERGGRPLFRAVAIGTASLMLLTGAFQASWGQGGNGDYDDDGGLSSGEIAAIAIGGVAAAYGIWLLAGADDDDDSGDAATEEQKGAALPGGDATAARLVTVDKLGAGEQAVVDLQVRHDGEWVSVSSSPSASIELPGASRVDGARNLFSLPLGAAAARESVAVGRVTLPSGKVLVAEKPVSLGG